MIINKKDIKILKFGTKDIGIASIGGAIYFVENTQYFNTSGVSGQMASDLINNHTKVVMEFDSIDSVNVLIETLEDVKKFLSRLKNNGE